MPQQTNLDVSPYFDDYNPADDFYRVLFKPGYPVQARELTTLQSILQNQIEKFGQHFFKDGAKVIPGNTSFNNDYRGVQLNNLYQGIPVAAYADQLVGTKITGETSFGNTLLIVTISVASLVAVVKASLALSLGLVGALSVIRFRTAVKEPLNLSFILLAISLAIARAALAIS